MEALSIDGLAQSAGVNVETVRYYERRGLLAQPERARRRRCYTTESVRRLALIRLAKSLKFTLAEIGSLLAAADGGSTEAILVAAQVKLEQVDADLVALGALRCRLTRLVRACAAADHGCVTLHVDPVVDQHDGTA